MDRLISAEKELPWRSPLLLNVGLLNGLSLRADSAPGRSMYGSRCDDNQNSSRNSMNADRYFPVLYIYNFVRLQEGCIF